MRLRRAVAIVNPATGRRDTASIIRQVSEVATARGIELIVRPTAWPGHAMELAREAVNDADVLLAIGGDGTVSDVIAGSLGARPVGIIPAGTTNMVAKDLHLPRHPKAAARIALGDGQPAPFDIARIGDTTAVHMAGAGYDAEIMRATSGVWKRRIGWAAYLPPALRLLNYPAFTARIAVDGVVSERRARVVLLAIGDSFIMARLRVGAGIDRGDGLIDVVVFDPPTTLAVLTTVAWIAAGKPERSRWQSQLRGAQVTLDADRPVAYQVDGDYLGELPVQVTMLDTRAMVIGPIARGKC